MFCFLIPVIYPRKSQKNACEYVVHTYIHTCIEIQKDRFCIHICFAYISMSIYSHTFFSFSETGCLWSAGYLDTQYMYESDLAPVGIFLLLMLISRITNLFYYTVLLLGGLFGSILCYIVLCKLDQLKLPERRETRLIRCFHKV